jgi:hypothetical protein
VLLQGNFSKAVVTELSSLLVMMDQKAQIAIAAPLRTAIWNWIEYFPTQFNDVIFSRAKMDGAPERVFDLLYAKVTNNSERNFWPTLTVLNCIIPEKSEGGASGASGAARGAKVNREKFAEEMMRHAKSQSKLADVSLICALDICRAATYVDPEQEVSLRLMANDIAYEIKVRMVF